MTIAWDRLVAARAELGLAPLDWPSYTQFAQESSEHRRARVRLQLRDKYGKWIEMGGGVRWNIGGHKFLHGNVVGLGAIIQGVPSVRVERSDTGEDVDVKHDQLETMKASLNTPNPADKGFTKVRLQQDYSGAPLQDAVTANDLTPGVFVHETAPDQKNLDGPPVATGKIYRVDRVEAADHPNFTRVTTTDVQSGKSYTHEVANHQMYFPADETAVKATLDNGDFDPEHDDKKFDKAIDHTGTEIDLKKGDSDGGAADTEDHTGGGEEDSSQAPQLDEPGQAPGAESYTDDELDAMGDAAAGYLGSGSEALNKQLRDDDVSSMNESWVEKLDDWIDWKATPAPGTVYRGASGDWLADLGVGDTVTDKGYLSTTTDAHTARTFAYTGGSAFDDDALGPDDVKAIFTFSVEDGVTSVDVDEAVYKAEDPDFDPDDGEFEHLLRRGHSFTITSIEQDDKDPNLLYIEADLHALDSAPTVTNNKPVAELPETPAVDDTPLTGDDIDLRIEDQKIINRHTDEVLGSYTPKPGKWGMKFQVKLNNGYTTTGDSKMIRANVAARLNQDKNSSVDLPSPDPIPTPDVAPEPIAAPAALGQDKNGKDILVGSQVKHPKKGHGLIQGEVLSGGNGSNWYKVKRTNGTVDNVHKDNISVVDGTTDEAAPKAKLKSTHDEEWFKTSPTLDAAHPVSKDPDVKAAFEDNYPDSDWHEVDAFQYAFPTNQFVRVGAVNQFQKPGSSYGNWHGGGPPMDDALIVGIRVKRKGFGVGETKAAYALVRYSDGTEEILPANKLGTERYAPLNPKPDADQLWDKAAKNFPDLPGKRAQSDGTDAGAAAGDQPGLPGQTDVEAGGHHDYPADLPDGLINDDGTVGPLHATAVEQQALAEYTSIVDHPDTIAPPGIYSKVNKQLREGDESNPAVEHLDALFEKAEPLAEDLKVTRYYFTPGKFGEKDAWLPPTMVEGTVLHDLGYMSTTSQDLMQMAGPSSNVYFNIRVPAGSKVLNVDAQQTKKTHPHLSHFHKDEKEILLPRGSRLRILKDNPSGPSGRRVVDAELIPDDQFNPDEAAAATDQNTLNDKLTSLTKERKGLLNQINGFHGSSDNGNQVATKQKHDSYVKSIARLEEVNAELAKLGQAPELPKDGALDATAESPDFVPRAPGLGLGFYANKNGGGYTEVRINDLAWIDGKKYVILGKSYHGSDKGKVLVQEIGTGDYNPFFIDSHKIIETDPMIADELPSMNKTGASSTDKTFSILSDADRGASGDGYYPGASGLWGKYGAAGVLIKAPDGNGEDRFLLVQRGPGVSSNKGLWQLPGGALDEKENAYQAAARETSEELGASSEFLSGLTPAGETAFNHPSGWTYTNIAATAPKMFMPNVDGHETSDAKWFTRDDIAEMVHNQQLVPALDAYFPDVIGHFNSPDTTTDSEEISDADAIDLVEAPSVGLPAGTDTSSWKKVGGQGGSNEGGMYEAPDGTRYYIKKGQSAAHVKNEVLATRLYAAMGIDIPEVNEVTHNGSVSVASKIVDGATPDLKSKLNDQAYIDKLREGFAADAWLANWDVAGLVFDNVVTGSDGNPYRIDTGGALLFRAQGAPKGGIFGDTVGELDTLRDPGMNPQSSKIFGGITNEQLKDSALHVQAMTPDQINDLVDSVGFDDATAAQLKSTLEARRTDLLEKVGLDPNVSSESDGLVSVLPEGLTPEEWNALPDWEKELLSGSPSDPSSSTEPDDPAPAKLDVPPPAALATTGLSSDGKTPIQVGHEVTTNKGETGTVVKATSNPNYFYIEMKSGPQAGKTLSRHTKTLTVTTGSGQDDKSNEPSSFSGVEIDPSFTLISEDKAEHTARYKYLDTGYEIEIDDFGDVHIFRPNGNPLTTYTNQTHLDDVRDVIDTQIANDAGDGDAVFPAKWSYVSETVSGNDVFKDESGYRFNVSYENGQPETIEVVAPDGSTVAWTHSISEAETQVAYHKQSQKSNVKIPSNWTFSEKSDDDADIYVDENGYKFWIYPDSDPLNDQIFVEDPQGASVTWATNPRKAQAAATKDFGLGVKGGGPTDIPPSNVVVPATTSTPTSSVVTDQYGLNPAPYAPQGKTDPDQSYDYTDFPPDLLHKFGAPALHADFQDMLDKGEKSVTLKFDYEEQVPGEAIRDALVYGGYIDEPIANSVTTPDGLAPDGSSGAPATTPTGGIPSGWTMTPDPKFPPAVSYVDDEGYLFSVDGWGNVTVLDPSDNMVGVFQDSASAVKAASEHLGTGVHPSNALPDGSPIPSGWNYNDSLHAAFGDPVYNTSNGWVVQARDDHSYVVSHSDPTSGDMKEELVSSNLQDVISKTLTSPHVATSQKSASGADVPIEWVPDPDPYSPGKDAWWFTSPDGDYRFYVSDYSSVDAYKNGDYINTFASPADADEWFKNDLASTVQAPPSANVQQFGTDKSGSAIFKGAKVNFIKKGEGSVSGEIAGVHPSNPDMFQIKLSNGTNTWTHRDNITVNPGQAPTPTPAPAPVTAPTPPAPTPTGHSVAGMTGQPLWSGTQITTAQGENGVIAGFTNNPDYVKVKITSGPKAGKTLSRHRTKLRPVGGVGYESGPGTTNAPNVLPPGADPALVGAPKPTPPPAIGAFAGRYVDVAWIQSAKDHYDTLLKGKPLEQSNTWVRFQRVRDEGSQADLDHLLKIGYLTPELHKSGTEQVAAQKSIIDQKTLEHGVLQKKYFEDLQAWGLANNAGMAGFNPHDFTLKGMQTPAKSFSSKSDGDAYTTKVWKKASQYPYQQKAAVSLYVSSSAYFNPSLWGLGASSQVSIDSLDAGTKKNIRDLDDAFETAETLQEDLILTRGTDHEEFGMSYGVNWAQKVGSVQTNWGYTSTSASNKAAMTGSVHIRIRVPKGFKAIGIGGNGFGSHNEAEVLLDRGTHFYIHKAVQNANGYWDIDAEVVPPGWDPKNHLAAQQSGLTQLAP